MKLREVIRAILGFKYEIWEYETFPNGQVTRQFKSIDIDQTGIRRLQQGMDHEELVGDTWWILTKEEFETKLKYYKTNKIVLRKKNETQTETKPLRKLSLIDRMIFTDHFMQRLESRFNVKPVEWKSFLSIVFKDHFIIQNYEFYNKRYRLNEPHNLAICIRDFKTILILKRNGSRLVLITCYNGNDPEYPAFLNWFQDHMDTLHSLPTLTEYFKDFT